MKGQLQFTLDELEILYHCIGERLDTLARHDLDADEVNEELNLWWSIRSHLQQQGVM